MQTLLTQNRRALSLFIARLCLGLLVFAVVCSFAQAETFYISNSADTTSSASLRGAIIAANLAGGDNTIVLTNTSYPLTLSGADETASYTGDLDVTNGSLTILRVGNDFASIAATNLGDRVFHVFPGVQLTLSNLIVTGGVAPGNIYATLADGEPGGAIYNEGTVILQNCIITNNSSGGGNEPEGNGGGTGAGDGGAIFNSGQLTMFDCRVANNYSGNGTDGTAGGNGGGVFNSGICQIYSCSLSGNSAGQGGGPEGNGAGFAGGGGRGGGIFNSGEMTLSNCALSGNFSGSGASGGPFSGTISGGPPGSSGATGGNGAGICNIGTLTLNACTISGNSTGAGGNGYPGSGGGPGGAGGSGAGIYSTGTITLNSCTLSGNSCGNGGDGGAGIGFLSYSAAGGAGGNGGSGGAIFNSGPMTLLACTVSENTGGAGGIGANGELGPVKIIQVNTNGSLTTNILAASDGVGGVGGNGGTGGIVSSTTEGASVSLQNVLVASNFPKTGGSGGVTQTTNDILVPVASGSNGASDITGPFASAGHNLIGQSDIGNGLISGAHGDLVGSTNVPLNPMLSTLTTNNGGFTATYNLLPGSPAIDAGDDAILNAPYTLTTDQRGEPRISGAHVDIGALEYNGIANGTVQPPIMESVQQSDAGIQLAFNAATQRGYSVLVSINLVDWFVVGSATEQTLGLFIFNDSAATSYQNRFYSIRQP